MLLPIQYRPHREKSRLCCFLTTKAQIRLRIRAVLSAPLFFALWKVPHLNLPHAKFQSSCGNSVRVGGEGGQDFFCHEHISERTLRASLEESNCLPMGSEPVFLRKHIATCDFRGGGGGSGPLIPTSGSTHVVLPSLRSWAGRLCLRRS